VSRLSIMPHAVERYRQRWVPHLTYEEARAELSRISEGARPEKNKTHNGQELWVANSDQKILFVVKRDRRTRERLCVTVLPQGANEFQDMTSPMDEYLEHEQEMAEMRQKAEQRRINDARANGRDCQSCTTGTVVRYSIRYKQRWCADCYQNALDRRDEDPKKYPIGRCPFIEEWEKKTELERRQYIHRIEDVDPVPLKATKFAKPAAPVDTSMPRRAADIFKHLYSTASWYLGIEPAEVKHGATHLRVSVTRMLAPHEHRPFSRDFMGYSVLLVICGVETAQVTCAADSVLYSSISTVSL
jgi:hypothetical protein